MDLDKQYYKIKDVAEILSLPQSTLRFWEKEFPLYIKPVRSPSGLRMYRPREIERLRIIRYLIKDKGLKIEAARAYLRSNPTNTSRMPETLATLIEVRDELKGLLDALGGRVTRAQLNDLRPKHTPDHEREKDI